VASRELEFSPEQPHQSVGLLSREAAVGDEVREVALHFKQVVGGVHAQ
jgi:hypothetical protein